MENMVKNHVKVLDPTELVNEGRKSGLTSCQTGLRVCAHAFRAARMSNYGVFVNHGPVKIKRQEITHTHVEPKFCISDMFKPEVGENLSW